jgi:hypothetical protein
MSEVRKYNWRGEACVRCFDEPEGWHIQTASHYGMCARHWLGATSRQRADAVWDYAMTCDDVVLPRVTTESIRLDLLFQLPDAERGWAA